VVETSTAPKDAQSVVLSSADVTSGGTCTVTVDGTDAGTATAGEAPAGTGMGGAGRRGSGGRPNG
jgi:hypothetical protein